MKKLDVVELCLSKGEFLRYWVVITIETRESLNNSS